MTGLEKLQNARTLKEFAHLIGYKPKAITFLLYHYPNDKYFSFDIQKKNGGTRKIKAPNPKLKKLQFRLANILNECYNEINNRHENVNTIVHGFRSEFSIATNANKHKKKRYVFNLDLQDFFPSINFGRVRGFFIKNNHFKLSSEVATIIAQIACDNNELPQGSPCSPVISNFIGHLLDIRLVKLAQKAKCTYTRYADDITFSTKNKVFPAEIALKNSENIWQPSEMLIKEIQRTGFSINNKKTSMQYQVSRQITTGLVVNSFVNVKREYYKYARAYCNQLYKSGEFYLNSKIAHKSTDSDIGSLNQLEGIINFIYTIKRGQDNRKHSERKDSPNAITKLYRRFLYYKHFVSLEKPLIICEGKTDIVYLKSALKRYAKDYPDLIKIEDGKTKFQLNFLRFTTNFKDIFAIAEGTTGIEHLIRRYKDKLFDTTIKPNAPVIVILDTDSGIKGIKKHLSISDFNNPFHFAYKNLYVTFVSKESDKEIEDLFKPEIRNTKIDGKSFNPKKTHGSDNEYGKQVFAEKVIKTNEKKIDFSGFKPIFDNINAILTAFNN